MRGTDDTGAVQAARERPPKPRTAGAALIFGRRPGGDRKEEFHMLGRTAGELHFNPPTKTEAHALPGRSRDRWWDLDRLHAYHSDLHREAALRAAQLAEGDAGRQREAQRIAAIARDYRAKVEDLERKYALRVTVGWVQTLELALPVQRLTVQIRRRKAERVVAMDWNPLTRRLEAPPCEASWSTERPHLVCDEALHLVVPAGLAPCPQCSRAYCRACHPRACPTCGRAEALRAFALDSVSASEGASRES